jgi:hypothetical protein
MLNDNAIAGPFAITAINMLQATHFIISLAIYYRGRSQALRLAQAQLGLAVATHGALLLVLVLLPILGWSRDWASIVPVYVWGAWECVVVVLLHTIYRNQLVRERRHLKLSILFTVIYCTFLVAYTVFCFLPPFPLISMFFSLIEGVLLSSVLIFLGLLLIHTKRIHFTMYDTPPITFQRTAGHHGDDTN